MNPIIHPLWFYLFDVLTNLNTILLTIGIVLAIFVIVFFIELSIEKSADIAFKSLKKYIILTIVVFLLNSLIPSKETCYTMMAASMVTPNNINTVGQTAEEIVDYIVDSVDQLLEEGSE